MDSLHTFTLESNRDGIPKDEFERLITEYLPITAEEIEGYAVFDEEKLELSFQRLRTSERTKKGQLL